MSPKASPQFIRRVAGKMVAKRRRQQGATSSKSKGFVAKASRKRTWMDYYSKNGLLICREKGSSIISTAQDKYQSVSLLQTTNGGRQVLRDFCYAFVKMICSKLKVNIINVEDQINWAERDMLLSILGRNRPADTDSVLINQTIAAATTFKSVADAIYNALDLKLQSYPKYSLSLCVVGYSAITTPVVPRGAILYLDLHYMRIQHYAKSAIKFQNRTVNSAGNVEADDVDNVPLYGKTYDGFGKNWIQLEDRWYYPPLVNEENSTNLASTVTGVLAEPAPLSTIKGCSKSGKIHLDPAEIKTSVLTSGFKMNANKFLFLLARDQGGDSNIVNLGKVRLITLEKMIQAVETTNENGIKLFYETDLKTGTIVTCPNVIHTTQHVRLDPL